MLKRKHNDYESMYFNRKLKFCTLKAKKTILNAMILIVTLGQTERLITNIDTR